MKLYATTTSERASKGQGGNKFLELSVTGEGGENILSFRLSPGGYGQRAVIVDGISGDKEFIRYLTNVLVYNLK